MYIRFVIFVFLLLVLTFFFRIVVCIFCCFCYCFSSNSGFVFLHWFFLEPLETEKNGLSWLKAVHDSCSWSLLSWNLLLVSSLLCSALLFSPHVCSTLLSQPFSVSACLSSSRQLANSNLLFYTLSAPFSQGIVSKYMGSMLLQERKRNETNIEMRE